MNTDRRAGNGRATRLSGKSAWVLALICAAALIGITTASASTTNTVVSSHNSKSGVIIVAGSNGHTLYGFANDGIDKSACYNACSSTFVPLWAKGTVVKAAGARFVQRKKLGKFRRRNGSYQATYYGHPLYTYIKEQGPHQLKAHLKSHFGGKWYAIDTNGSPAPRQGY